MLEINSLQKFKQKNINGRYLPPTVLNKFTEKLSINFHSIIIGYSVNQLPIYSLEWGEGENRILLWSQMHGNESTTTKALIDFMHYLDNAPEASQFKKNCKLFIVPMLNPDGANVYSRENANNVDLNRDFFNLTQPESRALMAYYSKIQPHFCFNLHDQRTIFGTGDTGNPATLSFLSPATNIERSLTSERIKAMQVIISMNQSLQTLIPNQISRFDDSYNQNCSGDAFQSLGTPTILIEAGHYQEDYNREITRKYLFFSLLKAIKAISENDIVNNEIEDYLNIPQNNPCFFDIVYRNVKFDYEKSKLISNFAVQFSEVLVNEEIHFEGFIVAVGDLANKKGHVEYNAQGQLFNNGSCKTPIIGQKADFYIGDSNKFINGKIIS